MYLMVSNDGIDLGDGDCVSHFCLRIRPDCRLFWLWLNRTRQYVLWVRKVSYEYDRGRRFLRSQSSNSQKNPGKSTHMPVRKIPTSRTFYPDSLRSSFYPNQRLGLRKKITHFSAPTGARGLFFGRAHHLLSSCNPCIVQVQPLGTGFVQSLAALILSWA